MKSKPKKKLTGRNWIAVAAFQRKGGAHTNKALRGSGKGTGRRHPKHKGVQSWN